MNYRSSISLVILLAVVLPRASFGFQVPQVPDGYGQLEHAPVVFRAGIDEQGREYFLNGQRAGDGKLIFTASNGFFSSGACRAAGESHLPKVGDKSLIAPNFAYLDGWKTPGKTIRWHVWIAKPGTVHFGINMTVAKQQAGSSLQVSFAGQERNVRTVAGNAGKAQPWNLKFEVEAAGEHTFSIAAKSIVSKKSGVGRLHTIDAFGPAIEEAQLLRARWRPAAVHGGYAASTCPKSRMWVMTTRSVHNTSSYSPITTPFGYYGTSFNADRRASGGFNFSMWAAGRGAKAPALERMPHLLAAGSPEAEFSGFGHEGSGVKLRGWTAMPDRPELVVQALRVENDGKYHTYYGYFWDHPTTEWKLYAVGRKWNTKPMTHLKPGSFCEVPGPPQSQRTGDVVREVRRHGWFMGPEKEWHQMNQFLCNSKGTTNKSWYTTSDGEFVMATGGMRYYKFTKPAPGKHTGQQPDFLSATATRQLFDLPAEFDRPTVKATTGETATLDIVLKQAGPNARGILYYGEIDCLTFARRKLHGTERNSAVSQSTQVADRSWQHSADIKRVQTGSNPVTLKNLTPGKTYHYRMLVINDQGKMWDLASHQFSTVRAPNRQ